MSQVGMFEFDEIFRDRAHHVDVLRLKDGVIFKFLVRGKEDDGSFAEPPEWITMYEMIVDLPHARYILEVLKSMELPPMTEGRAL